MFSASGDGYEGSIDVLHSMVVQTGGAGAVLVLEDDADKRACQQFRMVRERAWFSRRKAFLRGGVNLDRALVDAGVATGVASF